MMPGSTFTPAEGMRITATIDGVVCGETTVQLLNGQPGYILRVAANDPQDAAPSCGEVGKVIAFTVGEFPMGQTATWRNQVVHFLSLGQIAGLSTTPTQPHLLYLPLVQR